MFDSNRLRTRLLEGLFIPAHPLALNKNRQLDERHQIGLSRYYLSSGAGGLAVGVHTTQFAIHRPEIALYRPVLELAREVCMQQTGDKKVVLIAGIIGMIRQAVEEATLAKNLGYDCGLLGLGTLRHLNENQLVNHAKTVAEILPLFGFYLQPAVGGRILSYRFWRKFIEIENVVAIKIAPFNRYYTLDVVRALVDSGRQHEIALYTGNDDNIIIDLISPFRIRNKSPVRIVGGLLGHWAVWARRSKEIFERCRIDADRPDDNLSQLLELNVQVTDANAAFFDVANRFSGCIAGIHEVLRRQGLMKGNWCLDKEEALSPGQSEEIERVYTDYPHLNDDSFVSKHLDEWLSA